MTVTSPTSANLHGIHGEPGELVKTGQTTGPKVR